jgi:hypothetical protein
MRSWRVRGVFEDTTIHLRSQAPGGRMLAADEAAWRLSGWIGRGIDRAALVDMCATLGVPVDGARASDEALAAHVREALASGRLVVQMQLVDRPGVGRSPGPAPAPAPAPPPREIRADILEPKACVYAERPGQPLHATTLHAELEPPGGSATWTASNPASVRVSGAGPTATLSGLAPGTSDITVTYAQGGRTASDTIRCVTYELAIDHPSGDPVAAGAATNEFVFSGATPGVLSIECRARITPDDAEARACAEPHVFWEIDAVGASALAWSTPDPADPRRGKGLTATATFTGLPERNADFGAKTVRLVVEGAGVRQSTTIEVFFPKDDRNHPNMPGVPNWFYYWSQVVRIPAGSHLYYTSAATGNFGETRAMLNWSYATAQNKRAVHVMDMAATRDGAIAGLHGPLTGIDLFANTVLHEARHVRQVRDADAVVGVRAGTCWRYGWSWNTANHNHWSVGPDGQPGVAGVDDDADGTVDNQIVTGPGEMGAGDDVYLGSAGAFGRDWPSAWGAIPAGAGPGGAFIGGHPIEQQAFQAETSREHAYARSDWGAPGKNHRTVNRWND